MAIHVLHAIPSLSRNGRMDLAMSLKTRMVQADGAAIGCLKKPFPGRKMVGQQHDGWLPSGKLT